MEGMEDYYIRDTEGILYSCNTVLYQAGDIRLYRAIISGDTVFNILQYLMGIRVAYCEGNRIYSNIFFRKMNRVAQIAVLEMERGARKLLIQAAAGKLRDRYKILLISDYFFH